MLRSHCRGQGVILMSVQAQTGYTYLEAPLIPQNRPLGYQKVGNGANVLYTLQANCWYAQKSL